MKLYFQVHRFDDLKIYMLFHVAGNLSEIIYESVNACKRVETRGGRGKNLGCRWLSAR